MKAESMDLFYCFSILPQDFDCVMSSSYKSLTVLQRKRLSMFEGILRFTRHQFWSIAIYKPRIPAGSYSWCVRFLRI